LKLLDPSFSYIEALNKFNLNHLYYSYNDLIKLNIRSIALCSLLLKCQTVLLASYPYQLSLGGAVCHGRQFSHAVFLRCCQSL